MDMNAGNLIPKLQPVQPTYGCVMVPVDPTPEMLDRGANCAEYFHQNVYESDAEKIYAAMIAAAPQAIAQPVQPAAPQPAKDATP